MQIEVKLNKDFERYLATLREQYGDDFADINSLSDDKLSYNDFLDNFVAEETVADASADGSSNVHSKDIVTLRSEMSKPHEKLVAYSKIFHDFKKIYGLREAKKWFKDEWNKALYLHDANSATFVPYCFAYDLTKLAKEGLFYLDAHTKPEPAKHLETFVDFVKEFINFTSNRTSGACGLPNLIPYMYYFWYQDVTSGHYPRCQDEETFAKSEIQRVIYGMNQPYTRDGIQSAFVNTSIFDGEYFDSLFGGAEFPNGEFMIDHKEGILKFEKWFLEEMSAIKDRGRMFTFPVNSISLLKKDGKFVDSEFAEWACDQNRKWNDSNIFADKDVTSLSNCPLDGNTKILYWSDFYKKYVLSSIKNVYNNRLSNTGSTTIKVLSCGKEVKCKINKFDIQANYTIKLVNGASIKTTANHLNKVYNKDYIRTDKLTEEDYLPYSTVPYESNKSMSYEDGKIVGAFIGDGSYSNHGITLSLNSDTDREFMDWLSVYVRDRFGGTCKEDTLTSKISNESHLTNFSINSDFVRGLVEQCVDGKSALTKKINLKVLNYSIEFRKGIVDGLYQTDGGNSNRIYTSSKDLCETLVTLFASIGIVTNVSEDNRDDRPGSNTNYVIRWYDSGIRKQLKDTYIIDNDYMWVKIKSIKKSFSRKNTVSYCLQVEDDCEPVFMLGNGIITHNCRLKSNIKDIGYFNSIGGSGLRVGSIKVSTINLARIAYESKGNKKRYIDILKDRLNTDMELLHVIRNIIRRNVEKKLLPNFQDGIMDFQHLYNTIGVNGIYETMKFFNYTAVDEFGNTTYTDQAMEFGKLIFDTIHEATKAFQADKDYMINVEQIPGETAAVKFLKADKLLYPNSVVLDLPLYGNQWIPLGIKTTLKERVRICSTFDDYCNGGSICHINVDKPIDNAETAKELLDYITEQGVTYFAFNGKLSTDDDGHLFYGDICPQCGARKTAEWTRTVGFYTPTKTWSKERKDEYKLREWQPLNDKGVNA